MTNLGALESFIDHDAVNYELNGKAESFTFPADAVLKFHVAVAAMKENGESRFDRLKIYELVAPVFGSVWDPENATFTGGLLAKLLRAKQPFVVIDRLAAAVFVKLQYDDSELAEAMFRTGDLPKAIREQAERRKKEVEMERGETTGDDSEEQKTD